jgi:hypothetical protein
MRLPYIHRDCVFGSYHDLWAVMRARRADNGCTRVMRFAACGADPDVLNCARASERVPTCNSCYEDAGKGEPAVSVLESVHVD